MLQGVLKASSVEYCAICSVQSRSRGAERVLGESARAVPTRYRFIAYLMHASRHVRVCARARARATACARVRVGVRVRLFICVSTRACACVCPCMRGFVSAHLRVHFVHFLRIAFSLVYVFDTRG
jgi:hypothetical protein